MKMVSEPYFVDYQFATIGIYCICIAKRSVRETIWD